jgi:long-chain acyl-CoA synthetase
MESRIWHNAYDEDVPQEIAFEKTILPDLLDLAAARFPEAPAIHFMNRTLVYAELHDQVQRFATALSRLGVGPGSKVAVHLPNLPQTVIAASAVFRLGAQTVMTNPLYVVREIEHQWTDAGCEVAVTADFLYERVIKNRREMLPVRNYIIASIPEYLRFPLKQLAPLKLKKADPPLYAKVAPGDGIHFFSQLIADTPAEPPEVSIDFQDLAMLQYTGGTTGVAKGAMLSHANLSSNVQQIAAWFPSTVEGKEVMLAALPFFHIFGFTVCMLWAQKIGAALVLAPNPRDIPVLIKSITKHRVTIFPAVPAMFNAINEHPGIGKIDISSIHSCFSGSAPLPVAVLQRFEELTSCRIVEGFGLTETSPVTHVNPLRGVRKVGSIGVAMPSTDCRIVDAETGRTEMAPGEEGELIIKGPQVMQGYWNRQAETDEVLRDGWMFTGDLAALDEDGYCVIVGRKKDMIISSGYNIYPDEIDRALMCHPAVLEACTIGVPEPQRGETVKSFVVLKPGKKTSTEELRDYLREQVARYKVPRIIEFRPELPKSSMMKLLRRELRDEELKAIQEEE